MSQRFIKLNQWFSSKRGKRLARTISEQLEDHLTHFHGVHLLQCGIEEHQNWLGSSPIINQHILTPFKSHRPHAVISQLEGEYLPFESDSLNVVFLPFCLELLNKRQTFLHEVNRVLAQDGRVIIIGLNPYGFLGLRKKFRQTALSMNSRKRLVSRVKLNQLLSSTKFNICRTQSFSYTPYLKLQRKTSFFFDQLGKMLWPYPGNFYLIEAKKMPSMSVTPIVQYGNFIIGRPS